jgi:hypothetical protein
VRPFTRLSAAFLLALVLLAVAGAGLLWKLPPGRAQGEILVDKRLGRSSPLVRVGELLTFTIHITNTSGFTLTGVPLTDTYRADVLRYAFAQPFDPDEHVIAGNSGLLTWHNIATTSMFGPIPDGAAVAFTIGFTAEHPAPTVVNGAAVHDAVAESGQSVGAGSGQADNEVVGGAAPMEKRIEPPGYTPLVGTPLTFTSIITNDGAALLTVLPYRDRYDPDALAFHYAVPPPDLVLTATGVLSWFDLTGYFGDIPADTAVTVTAVFTVLPGIGLIETANQAEVLGALDEYANTLAAGADQVPITIIGAPTPTSTPAPRDDDEDDEEDEEETPTPAPTPAAASTVQPTPTLVFPTELPETGRRSVLVELALLIAGVGLLGATWLWRYSSRRVRE